MEAGRNFLQLVNEDRLETLTKLPRGLADAFATFGVDIEDDRQYGLSLQEALKEYPDSKELRQVFESYPCTIRTLQEDGKWKTVCYQGVQIVETIQTAEARAILRKIQFFVEMADTFCRKSLRLYMAEDGHRAKLMVEGMKADNSRAMSGEMGRTQMYQSSEPAAPKRSRFFGGE